MAWKLLSQTGLALVPCDVTASILSRGHLAINSKGPTAPAAIGLAWASVHTICMERSMLCDGIVISQPDISYYTHLSIR